MLITVVTAAYRPRADYLQDAYTSLCEQQLPTGWSWEWLVQLDGEGDPLPLPAQAAADSRVLPGSGPHGGPGVARTVALARARGRYVRNLDADDVLPPLALARAIELLEQHPEVGWTTCAALDLTPHGELLPYAADPPAGRIPRGRGYLRDLDMYTIGHPATVTIRRELLLSLGGWMALPTNEDLGLVASAAAVMDGWYIEEPGLHYRKHSEQITQSAPYLRDKQLHRNLVAQRVEALSSLVDHFMALKPAPSPSAARTQRAN